MRMSKEPEGLMHSVSLTSDGGRHEMRIFVGVLTSAHFYLQSFTCVHLTSLQFNLFLPQ